MNQVYYFNDPVFKQTNIYQKYIQLNPTFGYLNIHSYAANAALPIEGMKIEISKNISNQKIIFFEGSTDNSGMIANIPLPTPNISSNDEEIPASQEYEISAKYENQTLNFIIKMYANIQVNQNINIVPEMRLDGSFYGR